MQATFRFVSTLVRIWSTPASGCWPAIWMQITGACQVRANSADSQRYLRSCMRAVVRTRCCTDLTLKSQTSKGS